MRNFVRFVLLLQMTVATLSVAASRSLRRKQFVGLYEWTDLELAFPTQEQLRDALERGYYDRSKLVPVDLDMEYGDDAHHRAFLTIPRLNVGVPYSLAVVAESESTTVRRNPKLVPYPNYDWHVSQGSNCSGITSAIRTTIDDCWRLWVVDSGQINSVQRCAPQVLAFDLVTDKLLYRYTLPAHLYTPGVSVFTALAVDVGDTEPKHECRDTMIYIADPWGYGLIVYDVLAGESWRIEHALMQPDKQLQTSNTASDGIFTVSLDAKDAPAASRRLYFHALNSYTEVAVPLRVVNNASLWSTGQPHAGEMIAAGNEFRLIGSRGTQCESETMDRDGNMYCSLISSNALVSWSTGTDYNSDNLKVVAYSPQQLKFVTGLKVNRNAAEEDELWALSNDPRLFVGGRVKAGDVKFQIIGCRTSNLLANEYCTVQATARKRLH